MTPGTEVSLGVRRLGSERVNFYFVEDGGRVTVVDAGVGPQIMPGAFNVSSAQGLESLGRIEQLSADVVLPGHGEPWTGGPAEAVARAREVGPS